MSANGDEPLSPLGLWLSDRKLSVHKPDTPYTLRPQDALIKVLLSGICGTDLELVNGYYPYDGVLGHEFVGEIVDLGGKFDDTVREDWIGCRVVADIHDVCESCRRCSERMTTHCENRSTLGIINKHGSHATHCVMPLSSLHKVPKSVPNESAVFTEPLAAALNISERVHISPQTKVLVIGAGRLGQLCAWTLALTGCDLKVCARSERQQALLRKRSIKLISEEDTKTCVSEFDVVVECTGNSQSFPIAMKCVKPRGTIVLKSTYAGNVEVNLSEVVVKEVALIGNRCGSPPTALRLLESAAIDPRDLVDNIFALSDAVQAMSQAAERGAMKILLKPH